MGPRQRHLASRFSFLSPPQEEKVCASCGRRFAWRRKWARCWDQVLYCSDSCRRRKVRAVDVELEAAIIRLLVARTGTICPSDAARAVAEEGWRELMEPARRAGRRLAHNEIIRVQQKGRAVDPTTARGPIRFARGPAFPR